MTKIVPSAETRYGLLFSISVQAAAEATSAAVIRTVTRSFVMLCRQSTQSHPFAAVRRTAKRCLPPSDTCCSACGLNAG